MDQAQSYEAPLARDSISINQLGSVTGLESCGARLYEVQTYAELLTVDSSTRLIRLRDTVTETEVGSYTSRIKVYLADYPNVFTHFEVSFKVQKAT